MFRSRSGLLVLGVIVGVWATVPAWSGPELGVAQRVETADHLVPGFVVLVAAAVCVALDAAAGAPSSARNRELAQLLGGLLVAFAGLWMIATHGPLVLQAARDEVDAGAVAFHTAPGLAVAAVGAAWIARRWAVLDTR